MPTPSEIASELRCTVTLNRCSEYGCSAPGATIMPADWRCPACQAYEYLSAPADRDLAPLRALVEDWKLKARDAEMVAAQPMTSDREYYGRVNAAFVYRDCADELKHALAELTQAASDPPESR